MFHVLFFTREHDIQLCVVMCIPRVFENVELFSYISRARGNLPIKTRLTRAFMPRLVAR